MKKFVVILIIMSMVITLLLPIIVSAEPIDIFLSSGEILKRIGVLEGNSDGDLMLEKKLTRPNMVVLMSRLYKAESKAKSFLINPNFTDVTDSFYLPYIGWAVDKGLIKGMGDNTFGFDENVTVQQFMVVLLRVLEYEEESRLWNTVPALAIKLGIMEGLENNAKADLTRGQMAVMTLNALKMTTKGNSITLADVLSLDLN